MGGGEVGSESAEVGLLEDGHAVHGGPDGVGDLLGAEGIGADEGAAGKGGPMNEEAAANHASRVAPFPPGFGALGPLHGQDPDIGAGMEDLLLVLLDLASLTVDKMDKRRQRLHRCAIFCTCVQPRI